MSHADIISEYAEWVAAQEKEQLHSVVKLLSQPFLEAK